MNEEVFLALAHIAGEIWGTMARATLQQPIPPVPHPIGTSPGQTPMPAANRVLGYDMYFDILNRLKEDFKREVTIETETPDGEDD